MRFVLIVEHQTISTHTAEQSTEWADEEKNNTEGKKVLISLSPSLLPFLSLSFIPPSSHSACWLLLYRKPTPTLFLPGLFITLISFIKESDIHRRLARERSWCLATSGKHSKVKSCWCGHFYVAWLCGIESPQIKTFILALFSQRHCNYLQCDGTENQQRRQ